MGFRYRKSYGTGPFRINSSKSGVGWSVGTKGLRYTRSANGKSRVGVSVPGTGLSYTKNISTPSRVAQAAEKPQTAQAGGRKKSSVWAACLFALLIMLLALNACGQSEETVLNKDNAADFGIPEVEDVPTDTVQPEEPVKAEPKPEFVDPFGGGNSAEANESAGNYASGESLNEADVQQEVTAQEIVYYTDTGEKYHRAGCRHLSESQHETTLEDAISRGLSACGTCH